MCTATWVPAAGGYELLFNRDELRTRAQALPPASHESRGVRFLAPTDPDGGGTWLGVNAHGLTVGVGNGPVLPRDRQARAFTSRGLLATQLLACASADGVREALGRTGLDAFRSFALLALGPEGKPCVWRWDGSALREEAPASGALLFTSSKDPGRAVRERSALLARMIGDRGGLDAALLEAFHASHEPERGPFSPCMHREEASTVSRSRVRVTAVAIELGYAPGPPCRSAPEVVLRQERVKP